MKRFLILSAFLVVAKLTAQVSNPCIQDVLAFEKNTGNIDDTLNKNNTVYLSYTVKATNWDDESTISTVKIYRKGEEMRFFSEQANIYSNTFETVVEMPVQKILVMNDTHKKNKDSEAFQFLREDFMNTCEVSKCGFISKTTKALLLKVSKEQLLQTHITEISYEYDTLSKRVLNVQTTYNEDYKLKTVKVIYNEFDDHSNYEFAQFEHTFIDRKGKLNSRYKGYELVDNRDKKSRNSRK